MKINLDIVNNITYKYAKFYYEILYIIGYTKITKSDKICIFEMYVLSHFCVAQNMKYLNIIFCNFMIYK
jgi:hypothetical protein